MARSSATGMLAPGWGSSVRAPAAELPQGERQPLAPSPVPGRSLCPQTGHGLLRRPRIPMRGPRVLSGEVGSSKCRRRTRGSESNPPSSGATLHETVGRSWRWHATRTSVWQVRYEPSLPHYHLDVSRGGGREPHELGSLPARQHRRGVAALLFSRRARRVRVQPRRAVRCATGRISRSSKEVLR